MSSTILHKSSAVSAKVPLPGDLIPGELAINTADGVLYTKKDDNTIAEIGVGVNLGELEFVATGAIGSGDVVGLRSDGTVEVITDTNIPGQVGTEGLITNATFGSSQSTYDSVNNKVIVVYTDNSEILARIGTVSGTSITFGSAIIVANSTSGAPAVSFHPTDGVIVFAYAQADAFVRAGTYLDDDTITFGTEVVIDFSSSITDLQLVFDSTSDKMLVTYVDSVSSDGYIRPFTLTGTSIALGTEYNFNAFTTNYVSLADDSTSGQVILVFSTSNGDGQVILVTVNGNFLSLSSTYTFETGVIRDNSVVYDTLNNKVVIAYSDAGLSLHGYAIVGTVVGTSITFGTSVLFSSAAIGYTSADFDPNSNRCIIGYAKDAIDYGTVSVGTVSGTSISFEVGATFNSDDTSYIATTYDSLTKNIIFSYRDNGTFGYAKVYTPSYVTTTVNSTIGISAEAIADAGTGIINTMGSVNDQQSGLTIGETYNVQFNGAITTTPDVEYDSKILGQAISTTEILIGRIR